MLALAALLDWAAQRWLGPLIAWRIHLPGLILRQATVQGEASVSFQGGTVGLWILTLKTLLALPLFWPWPSSWWRYGSGATGPR